MDLWLAGGEDNRGEETRFGCKKTDDTPCLVNLVNLSGSPTIVPIVYVAYHLENRTKIKKNVYKIILLKKTKKSYRPQ